MSATRTVLLLAVIATSIQMMSCQKNDVSVTSNDVVVPPDLSVVNYAFTATPPAGDNNFIASALRAAPLRIEAENYTAMRGVQVEACREGGQNVGYISTGDWMEYSVNLATAGSQQIYLRVAGPGGSVRIQKPDGTILGTATLPPTTSGQVYATGSVTVNLPAGKQTLRLYALTPGWNFNWLEFAGGAATTTPGNNPPGGTTGNNVTIVSTFESTSDFNKWNKEICRSSALQISNEVPARKGSYSTRFELTKSDVLNYRYTRAEIRQKSFAEAEKWYGFSNYLPGDFITDPLAEKIAQWHDIPDFDLGETWRSPPLSLGIINGRYYLHIQWASKAVNTDLTKDGQQRVDLGPVDKMKWNDWVFHIKFSYKSDGILEVWKNKVKVFSLYGPNSFNDRSYPYFKIGIYKWGWDGWASYSPENKRVLYYDEIRIANRGSNVNEVSPQ